MADIKLSGYKAAATSVAWSSGQDLGSPALADDEYTDLSDEIDNSTNLYAFADIEVVLASAAFTGANSNFEIYLVPSVDGTNYPTWTGNGTSDEQENEQYHVGTVKTTGTTAAQRMAFRDVPLPNGKYKYAFRNRTGVVLATTGNTVKWRPHQIQSA